DLRAERSHDRETVVDLGDLYIVRLDPRHLVSGFHCFDRPRGAKHIAASLLERVGGLRIPGNLDAVLFVHAELCQSFLSSEDERGIAVGDLRTIVGLERQPFDNVAIDATDLHRLFDREIDFAHVRVLGDGDLRQVFFRNAVHFEIALHHLRKEVGEDVYLAFTFVGMRKIPQGLADELSIHLAFGVAHFFVADRNSDIAPSDLQLLDDGQDGLATGGARIFDRLDRLTGESRNLGHEACEQSLLVERYIASGAHGAYIDRGGFHLDLRTGLFNGALKNLGHSHAHELSKFRLMIGGDVNVLHNRLLKMTSAPAGQHRFRWRGQTLDPATDRSSNDRSSTDPGVRVSEPYRRRCGAMLL